MSFKKEFDKIKADRAILNPEVEDDPYEKIYAPRRAERDLNKVVRVAKKVTSAIGKPTSRNLLFVGYEQVPAIKKFKKLKAEQKEWVKANKINAKKFLAKTFNSKDVLDIINSKKPIDERENLFIEHSALIPKLINEDYEHYEEIEPYLIGVEDLENSNREEEYLKFLQMSSIEIINKYLSN